MVRALRAELGSDHGVVARFADQLGYGVESVRLWVRQADIDDGYQAGVSTTEAQRMKQLEQENRELKRANEILKPPSTYYAAKKRSPSGRARRDAVMAPALVRLWEDNYSVYGARKLWKAARRAGHDIGRDQVAR